MTTPTPAASSSASGSLDVQVHGDPKALRASATALSRTGEAIRAAGDTVARGRADSERIWTGAAGDGFRRSMTTALPRIDDLADDHAGICRALNAHADDLDTAKRRMADALHIANQAGLPVTATSIGDPGPPPAAAGAAPAPSLVPAGAPPQVLAQAQAADQQALARYDAAAAAEADWNRRAAAYTECSRVVTQARADEASAQARLGRFADGVYEKRVFNAADFVTGAGGAMAARASQWRAVVDHIDNNRIIDRAMRLMDSPHLTEAQRTRALHIGADNLSKLERANRYLNTGPARVVDKLPATAQDILKMNLAPDKIPDGTGKFMTGAMKVGQKLPVIGLGLTTLGVGYDVTVAKKDPTTSVVSGLSGYAAGALAGAGIAAMGGPVGWVVAGGLVASVGIGFLVEDVMS